MSTVTLDLEFTRANLDGDCELVKALIQIAVEDLAVLATDLRSAFDQNELGQVRRLAHAIKGLASNFRAEPLTSLTRRLEESVLEFEEPVLKVPVLKVPVLKGLVDEIAEACTCTVLALSTELNQK